MRGGFMKYKAFTTMLILGIVFMVAPVFGAAKEKGMAKKPRHPELTAEQMQSIKKLEIQNKKNCIPLHADLQVKQIELDELLASGADESKIDAKIEKISNLHAKLLKQKVNLHLGIRKLLPEGQRAHFDMMGLCGDRCQCPMKKKFMKHGKDKCEMDRPDKDRPEMDEEDDD